MYYIKNLNTLSLLLLYNTIYNTNDNTSQGGLLYFLPKKYICSLFLLFTIYNDKTHLAYAECVLSLRNTDPPFTENAF